MEILLIIMISLIVIISLVAISLYNSLISARNKVNEGYSGMYVQMKRRFDLIPNLIETVEGYSQYERSTLDTLTKLRTEFMKIDKDRVGEVFGKEAKLESALKTIFAIAEGYADLKASANYLELQRQLATTEDQVAAARRIYNANVNGYNNAVQQFPSSVIAKMFGFVTMSFYEPESVADVEKVPQVKLTQN